MGEQNKQIVGFFPGVFDFVHAGHCLAFKEAKQHCSFLLVGLQTDTGDRPDKTRPCMSPLERLLMLRANKYVDGLLMYTTQTELNELDQTLSYDIRFMGEDHKDEVQPYILKPIIYLTRNHNYSSTNLRKRIQQ